MLRSIALALALGACADKTGILIEVTSDDLEIPADIDALRFQVTSTGGHAIDETFDVDTDWPHSLTILPADDSDGAIFITVTGLHGTDFRVRRVLPSEPFRRGETTRVVVLLSRNCLMQECPVGVDCLNGMCAGEVDGGMSDGGMDAGMDAGMQEIDGGRDGGMRDAGMRDGGRDAGMDGGRDAGMDAGPIDAGPPPDLIFSEYVEGDALNKALEIQNVGTSTASLAMCSIRRYSNGATTSTPIALSGTLAAGDTLAVCNGSLDMAATRCDILNGQINHNGDDAYDLICNGTVLDTIGQIGFDPGTAWTGGGLSTAEYVLTRRCTVTTGDVNGADAFDPSVEWSGAAWSGAATSLTGLGSRAECP